MQSLSPQQNLKAALQASQTWWQDMGIDTPPVPPATLAKAKRKQTASQKASKPSPSTPTSSQAPAPQRAGLVEQIAKAKALASASPTLEALKLAIEGFDAGILSDHAQKIVFARGKLQAKIMAIGEAPGRHEDETGMPFVGPAGQLLDKMFAAINLDADSLYITNVCNWRPPNNRNPSEDELALCKPFITRHMELVAPKLIIIVGGVSLQALTGKTGIMKTRGQWQELDVNGAKIPAIPLYHPAFLLRRPELKKYAWRDLLAVRERIENP